MRRHKMWVAAFNVDGCWCFANGETGKKPAIVIYIRRNKYNMGSLPRVNKPWGEFRPPLQY